MPGKFPTDPVMIAELNGFIAENKLTYKALCKMLLIEGVNETFLYKYIGDKLDRQVDNFEIRCRDMLKGHRERIAFGSEIFESSVTRKIGDSFNLMRLSGQIGLATGPAGHGKTSGIRRFIATNPSAVLLTLNESTGTASRLLSVLFSKIDHQSWNGRTPRFDYLKERFADSGRMILIDNWQRLKSCGRNLLFDFHDETNSPIGGIGNPEALKPIIANDQHSRRLGIVPTYQLLQEEFAPLAHRVTRQFADTATADAIGDLVAVIAAHDGALGSVQMTVILMQQLRKLSAKLDADPRAALRAAHSRLNRNYLLPED